MRSVARKQARKERVKMDWRARMVNACPQALVRTICRESLSLLIATLSCPANATIAIHSVSPTTARMASCLNMPMIVMLKTSGYLGTMMFHDAEEKVRPAARALSRRWRMEVRMERASYGVEHLRVRFRAFCSRLQSLFIVYRI